MSSENTLTGRGGRFSVDDALVARITEWSVNPTMASTSEWGDSDSSGYTNRAAGRRDCTFDASGKYDTTDEVFDLFEPGDNVQASLWQNSTVYWDFPRALCDDFSITVDVDSEEVIGWESSFGSDGEFTRPGASSQVSRSLPS